MLVHVREIKPAREPLSGISHLFSTHPFIFIGLSLLIFATIILVITAINVTSGVEVDIRFAPASAALTIDGKSYENGQFRLESGTHRVHLEKDGFVTQDFTFDTTKSTKLYAYLLQEDGTYSWYIDHLDDALILDFIGGSTADAASASYAEKHPVMDSLPLVYIDYTEDGAYAEYRIDGGSFKDCSSDFCLKITDTTGGNYDAALDLLRSHGHTPADYEILYEYTPITPLN